MGSAFIGYGILLAVALFVGSEWLRRVGHSQEWFDSWVIMLWGIVNTFTEVGSCTVWFFVSKMGFVIAPRLFDQVVS